MVWLCSHTILEVFFRTLTGFTHQWGAECANEAEEPKDFSASFSPQAESS